jgi:hypothetical protein
MTAGGLARKQVVQMAVRWGFQTAASMGALTADLLASPRDVTLELHSVVSRDKPLADLWVARKAEPMVDPTVRRKAAWTVDR